MKTVGLITEYNPFHNGHLYHIEQAKKITGADHVIVVMSGDFVQRGTPAIMNKFQRTTAALLCGADFVFELPVCYATGSAEFFAEGAVKILTSLGITDSLCFGSECGDINILESVADILINEPDIYRDNLQIQLKKGFNYAKARANAFKSVYPQYLDILETPNNILGIEYIKALKKSGSNIKPFTIKRKGQAYHDSFATEHLSSATAIRKLWMSDIESFGIASNTFSDYNLYVPEVLHDMYASNQKIIFPICEDDFSQILYYKLHQEIRDGNSLKKYSEVNTELANRIEKLLPQFKGFSGFAMLLKNKSYTYSRICRCLTHIMLDIKTDDLSLYRQNGLILYNRLLGMKNTAVNTELLSSISKASAHMPLLTTVKPNQNFQISEPALQMLRTNLNASDIYEHVSCIKYACNPQTEAARKFIKI